MAEVFVLIGVGVIAFVIGGSLVAGAALVCRWLKWAPINITVKVNNYGEDQSYLASVEGAVPHE
jgi:hypothetical protein